MAPQTARLGRTRQSPASWVRILVLLFAAAAMAGDDDVTQRECPVVGNEFSRIYHVPGHWNYRQMLHRNARGRDNRVCFRSEAAARTAGYRRSRAPQSCPAGGDACRDPN